MTQPPGPGPGPEQPPPSPFGRAPTFGPPGRHAQGYQPPPGPPPGYYAPGPGYYGPPGYPPPPYYPPYYYAPRPGCVPLRPLGLGDILDGAFKVVRRNPKTTLGLSAVVAAVQAVIAAVTLLVALHALRDEFDSIQEGTSTSFTTFDPTQLITTFLNLLMGGILTGILTVVVTQDVLGRKVSLGEAWRTVRPRMWTLLALSLTTSIVPGLGLLLCIAPGVWLWGIWTAAIPACMVEQIGVRAALGRSKRLVDGTFWRVWGIRALGVLIIQVVSALILVPFTIFGVLSLVDNFDDSGAQLLFVVLFGVGSLISRTFTAPIQAGIDALLYVDLRMRKEGLDIALQQAVTAAPSTGPLAAD